MPAHWLLSDSNQKMWKEDLPEEFARPNRGLFGGRRRAEEGESGFKPWVLLTGSIDWLQGGAVCHHRIGFSTPDFYGVRLRFSGIPFFCGWKSEVISSSAALHCRRSMRFVRADVPGALCLRWNHGGFCFRGSQPEGGGGFPIRSVIDVASAVDVINDLGFDTLTFLAVTVMVVPAFKFIRANPVSSMVETLFDSVILTNE
ncbi:hypothetical protein KSP40_PGU002434 [Platanthera guangdongensis]|uniref:Uncharacterized protein n=1 Tax=Platanthera guangdongensis TaxID=2320717 RepID=A0ABR2MGZ6_9ASPA